MIHGGMDLFGAGYSVRPVEGPAHRRLLIIGGKRECHLNTWISHNHGVAYETGANTSTHARTAGL